MTFLGRHQIRLMTVSGYLIVMMATVGAVSAGGSMPPAPANDTSVSAGPGDQVAVPISQGITGVLVSKTKGPVAGVTIQPIAEGNTPPILVEIAYVTDKDGRFSVQLAPGSWTIRAIVDGINYDKPHLSVTEQMVTDIAIQIP